MTIISRIIRLRRNPSSGNIYFSLHSLNIMNVCLPMFYTSVHLIYIWFLTYHTKILILFYQLSFSSYERRLHCVWTITIYEEEYDSASIVGLEVLMQLHMWLYRNHSIGWNCKTTTIFTTPLPWCWRWALQHHLYCNAITSWLTRPMTHFDVFFSLKRSYFPIS